ncbi:uncharacterized protein LOC121796705 [Salvia splendens]|uniref:uncharacterized protein LOC121796705 n=1 Tax=Salvia splendens TaxID=180675 RepID=UPI001C257B60|nr:uncharacterized protein LOC121796705 [Salvia splendens]
MTKIPQHLNLSPKVFGFTVYVHIPKHERTKLSPCATKCAFVGYGINQKGYRCFDPLTKKVITTMNCNFLETEFFYHTHLSSQGESDPGSSPDYLSWVVPLPNSSIEDPTEPVVIAAEQVSPQESSHSPSPDPPSMISEVIPEPDPSENTVSPNPLSPDFPEEDNTIDSDTGGYVLPHRTTRGIPPKRYSPEKIGKKSRYGVANFVQGNLAKMARAFEAALYEEEEIPQSGRGSNET